MESILQGKKYNSYNVTFNKDNKTWFLTWTTTLENNRTEYPVNTWKQKILLFCCILVVTKLYIWCNFERYLFFLACLFWRKSWAIVIARSSLLLLFQALFKNFDVVQFTQEVLKVLTLNLEYLLIMRSCCSKTRVLTLNTIFLELCPFLIRNFKNYDAPQQASFDTACGALVSIHM